MKIKSVWCNKYWCFLGEMESDQEDRTSRGKPTGNDKPDGKDLNISHEDLSDVSDLDSMGPEDTDKGAKVCL